jgi:hypothetical protein
MLLCIWALFFVVVPPEGGGRKYIPENIQGNSGSLIALSKFFGFAVGES